MDMNNVWVGACKFCGQCVPGMYTNDMDQEQRDAIATENCDCTQAAAERKIKEQIRKAKERVESLFLEGAPSYGLQPVESQEIIELLYMAINAVGYNKIQYVTIGMGGYQKAKISSTAKGKIKIERESAKKRKFEE